MTGANDDLASGERWVSELEDHPLDFFEYETLLKARQGLARSLEVAGDERLFDRADSIDVRFCGITEDVERSPFDTDRGASAQYIPGCLLGPGWWWQRLPTDVVSRNYTLIGAP